MKVYYYRPEQNGDVPDDTVLDPDSGLTWRDRIQAMENLSRQKGHNGPFNEDEYLRALNDAVISRILKEHVERGTVQLHCDDQGEWGFSITDEGVSLVEGWLIENGVDPDDEESVRLFMQGLGLNPDEHLR